MISFILVPKAFLVLLFVVLFVGESAPLKAAGAPENEGRELSIQETLEEILSAQKLTGNGDGNDRSVTQARSHEAVRDGLEDRVYMINAPNGMPCVVLYERDSYGASGGLDCDWGFRQRNNSNPDAKKAQ